MTQQTHCWMLYVEVTRDLLLSSFIHVECSHFTQTTSQSQIYIFKTGAPGVHQAQSPAFTKKTGVPSGSICLTGRTEAPDGLLP